MATKQLILLRHAKSDWESGAASDHDRPLSRRGCQDAPRVGAWFRDNDYQPDRIICSSSARTRETLDLVHAGANWNDPDIVYEEALYLASESQIMDLITENFEFCDRLMMVGHNPGMDYVLFQFCPEVKTSPTGKLMTTAAFAIINFTSSDMSNPKLLHFIRPRELD